MPGPGQTDRKMTADQAMRRLDSDQVAMSTTFADSHQVDAFGKLRVSSPFGLYESKHLYNVDDRRTWVSDTNGVGASISHLPNEAAVQLAVGTADGEYSILQNAQYHIYVPGRSQHILMTGAFNTPKENLIQRIGYFDNENGLFFEQNGLSLRVVVRSKATGSVVDTAFEQDVVGEGGWNREKLNGSNEPGNPSGHLLDISKVQIFLIDFQWLGVGRVRFGVLLDGHVHYVHTFTVSNEQLRVYMATPNLPARVEIRNSGVTASASALKQICVSVQTEGGTRTPGYEFSASNGIVTRSINSRTPILAVRMAPTYGGLTNRVIGELSFASVYTNSDIFYEVIHAHEPVFTGGAWADVFLGDSAVQFNAGMTSVAAAALHPVRGDFATAAVGTSKADVGDSSFTDLISRHRFFYRNKDNDNSSAIIVYATPFTGTANVSVTLNWVELY